MSPPPRVSQDVLLSAGNAVAEPDSRCSFSSQVHALALDDDSDGCCCPQPCRRTLSQEMQQHRSSGAAHIQPFGARERALNGNNRDSLDLKHAALSPPRDRRLRRGDSNLSRGGAETSVGLEQHEIESIEVQIVLELCDCGSLRQALDRRCFLLPPGGWVGVARKRGGWALDVDRLKTLSYPPPFHYRPL